MAKNHTLTETLPFFSHTFHSRRLLSCVVSWVGESQKKSPKGTHRPHFQGHVKLQKKVAQQVQAQSLILHRAGEQDQLRHRASSADHMASRQRSSSRQRQQKLASSPGLCCGQASLCAVHSTRAPKGTAGTRSAGTGRLVSRTDHWPHL